MNSQHTTGLQFGRSIDPASNSFTTNGILYANHGLDIGFDIFNWHSKRNAIAANSYLVSASEAKLEKAKSDIAMNVLNAYLLALLNKEQITISKVQLDQSREQANTISRQVKAGTLPELNLVEVQAQLATDSVSVIVAETNYTLSLFQLKALLNLDMAIDFDIESPPIETIPIESLLQLDPALVYQSALRYLPQQKIND